MHMHVWWIVHQSQWHFNVFWTLFSPSHLLNVQFIYQIFISMITIMFQVVVGKNVLPGSFWEFLNEMDVKATSMVCCCQQAGFHKVHKIIFSLFFFELHWLVITFGTSPGVFDAFASKLRVCQVSVLGVEVRKVNLEVMAFSKNLTIHPPCLWPFIIIVILDFCCVSNAGIQQASFPENLLDPFGLSNPSFLNIDNFDVDW